MDVEYSLLENIEQQKLKRNPSILSVLDPLHRSILLKNLQFEEDALLQPKSNNNNSTRTNKNVLTTTTHGFGSAAANVSVDNKLKAIDKVNSNEITKRIVVDDVNEVTDNEPTKVFINKTNLASTKNRQQSYAAAKSNGWQTTSEENNNTCLTLELLSKSNSTSSSDWLHREISNLETISVDDFESKNQQLQPTTIATCKSFGAPYTVRCKNSNSGHATTDQNGNIVIEEQFEAKTYEKRAVVHNKLNGVGNTERPRKMEATKQKVITITIKTKQSQNQSVVSPKKSPKVVTFHKSTPKRYSSEDETSCSPSETTTDQNSRSPSSCDGDGVDEELFHDCHDFQEIIQGITDVSDGRNEDDDFQTPTPTFHTSDLESDNSASPLIHIVQELSKSMVVTSTVTINKAKLKKNKSTSDVRSTGRSKSRKTIIGEDFCDEVLAETQNIRYQDYENSQEEESEETPTQDEDTMTEHSMNSEDSNVSFGSLNAKPRYSGQEIGKLLARRLKKAEKIKQMYAHYPKLGDIDETIAQNSFLYERQKLMRRKGPEKPKRTFAQPIAATVEYQNGRDAVSAGNSDTTMEVTDVFEKKLRRQSAEYEQHQNKQNLKLHNRNRAKLTPPPQPSCPTFEELERPREHRMGVVVPKEQQNNSIPPDILNMLNYSDDERVKRFIVTSNSRAVPQKSSSPQALEYPKLDIDTVDGPLLSPAPTHFDQFAANTRFQSTPRKPPPNPPRNLARSSKKFLDMERIFCEDQAEKKPRMASGVQPVAAATCENCNCKAKRKSFRKTALRRTKTFFDGAKQKLANQKIFRHHDKPKETQVFSDPETYCTPDNSFTTRMNQQEFLRSAAKLEVKHLGWTPDVHPHAPKAPQLGWVPDVRPHATSSPTFKSHEKRQRLSEGDTPPRKPARQSLDFQDVASNTTPNLKKLPKTPPAGVFDRKFNKFVRSPLKKLNSIKVSPKKLFGGKQKAVYDLTATTAADPSYKSYNDTDHEVTREIMSDYLGQIREQIEGSDARNGSVKTDPFAEAERQQTVPFYRQRHLSTSSEFLDRTGERQVVSIDLHEPVYAEVNRSAENHPNPNHKIVEKNNKRYLMVNDAIYSLVDKNHQNKNHLPRSKSMKSLKTGSEKSCECSAKFNQTIDVVDAEKSSITSDTILRHLRSGENLEQCFEEIWASSSAKPRKVCRHKIGTFSMNIHESVEHDNEGARPESEVGSVKLRIPSSDGGMSIQSTQSSFKTNVYESEDGISLIPMDDMLSLWSNHEAEELRMAAIDRVLSPEVLNKLAGDPERLNRLCHHSSTDSVFNDKRLDIVKQRYDRSTMKPNGQSRCNTYEKPVEYQEVETQITSVVSAIHKQSTLDTENGYDTVDYAYIQSNFYENQQFGNSEKTETTREMMSSPDTSFEKNSFTVSNIISPSDRYKSWKNKLRNSFRKSKKYLRYEQNRLINLFEDKQKSKSASNEQKIVPSSNLEEYKKIYSDQKAEKLYQTLNSKLLQQQQTGIESLEDLSGDHYMLELIEQITTQRAIKRQLRNALEICRSRPEFECSTELIEAERLLLLSNLKEAAAKRELTQFESEGRLSQAKLATNLGTIAFNHCEFPLADATVFDSIFNYYYVCVFTYKNQVKATLAKERNEDRVYFRNCEIKFEDVEPAFEIKMEIYALRVRKPVRNYSHESKFHLNKAPDNCLVSCLPPSIVTTPKKMFSSSPSKSASPRINNEQRQANLEYEFSHFKSQGCMNITSYSLIPDQQHINISQTNDIIGSPFYTANNYRQLWKKVGDRDLHYVEDSKVFKLSSVIYNSTIRGVFMINMRSEIVLDRTEMNGFLNVGEVKTDSIVWNRRWCRIDGPNILFFNDPQDNEETPPILNIDLAKCISDKIELADRSICARPRTFAVELFDKHHLNLSSFIDNNTKTFLLSTDNSQDLANWMEKLNKVLKFIKDWKV